MTISIRYTIYNIHAVKLEINYMDHLKLLVLASILRCGPGKVGFFERGRGIFKI